MSVFFVYVAGVCVVWWYCILGGETGWWPGLVAIFLPFIFLLPFFKKMTGGGGGGRFHWIQGLADGKEIWWPCPCWLAGGKFG